MKKVLLAIVAVVSLGNAFAEPIERGEEILTGDCAVLGESVRINLSANVIGAYECSESRNAINVGACHTSGSRTGTLVCGPSGTDATTGAPTYTAPCTAQNDGQTVDVTPDYRGFRATTLGGSVTPQMLGGSCTTTTVESLVTFN